MTIQYILKTTRNFLVKQHQHIACSSILNAFTSSRLIVLFAIHREWLLGSCLRQICGFSYPLDTEGVLSSALASIALLTTGG